jgi:hypothetical protein
VDHDELLARLALLDFRQTASLINLHVSAYYEHSMKRGLSMERQYIALYFDRKPGTRPPPNGEDCRYRININAGTYTGPFFTNTPEDAFNHICKALHERGIYPTHSGEDT